MKTDLPPPFSAALIGVGGYGGEHLKQPRALEAAGRLRLVAVADPFLEGDALAKTRVGLDAAGVRIYADHRELCAAESRLGLVSIVAPIPWHEKMVEHALATGARIYLEKPPVPTIQQWRRLVALDPHERVSVGFQMLAMEPLRELRRWMEAGELGEVQSISFGGLWSRDTAYFARARWAGKLALDGEPVFDGPATNAMSHLVNNVMFLAAAGTPEVCATPARFCGPSTPGWCPPAASTRSRPPRSRAGGRDGGGIRRLGARADPRGAGGGARVPAAFRRWPALDTSG